MKDSKDKTRCRSFGNAVSRTNRYNLYKNQSAYSVEKRISMLLLQTGILPNLRGYSYLLYAIKAVIAERKYITEITSSLYPAVAKRFETTPSRVERAIRHSIEKGADSGKMLVLNEIFGFEIFGTNEKPTNGNFIALIAHRVLLDTEERGFE